jgi:hydroxyethylthiazole kinase-like uncharacterized protein yjeF
MSNPDDQSQNGELYQIEQIRDVEERAKAQLPSGTLMRAAGAAAAVIAMSLLQTKPDNVSSLILAGPGDNGGDAFEVAHLLALQGIEVTVLQVSDSANYSKDASESRTRACDGTSNFTNLATFMENDAVVYDLIVDGLFGIGLSRAIDGLLAQLIQRLNALSELHQTPVLALDVPSGLHADTGRIIGENGVAIRATHTVTFIANKSGLHTGKGKDYAGQVITESLNIAPKLYPIAYATLVDEQSFHAFPFSRPQDSNKGNFGDVLVIGGAKGMLGAPLLAARTALFCGTGRVYIGFLASSSTMPLYDPTFPELMCRQARDCDFTKAVVAIGPGLGQGKEAHHFLRLALRQSKAIVIDADALNLIAINQDLKKLVRIRFEKQWQTIMTPHPLEAARLLNCDVTTIQNDRCTAAQKLAQTFNATIILKGAGTIIATPNGRLFINTTGNPSLATAGTGDVLTGICAAFLAQDLSASDAACLAVFTHGAAADHLVANGQGPIGISASELIPAIRLCLNKYGKHLKNKPS